MFVWMQEASMISTSRSFIHQHKRETAVNMWFKKIRLTFNEMLLFSVFSRVGYQLIALRCFSPSKGSVQFVPEVTSVSLKDQPATFEKPKASFKNTRCCFDSISLVFPESPKTLSTIWIKIKSVCCTIKKIFNLFPKLWLLFPAAAIFVLTEKGNLENGLKIFLMIQQVRFLETVRKQEASQSNNLLEKLCLNVSSSFSTFLHLKICFQAVQLFILLFCSADLNMSWMCFHTGCKEMKLISNFETEEDLLVDVFTKM